MDLDLHGVRHHEVDRIVENFIYCNQDQMPLKIICGNSTRMVSLVKEVTDRVGCEMAMLNFGTIVIYRFV